MIKDNQSVLNKLMVFIDAILLAGTFVLSYLIKFYILEPEPGVGVLPLASYVYILPFIVVGYLLIYLIGDVYSPKRTSSIWRELGLVFRANTIALGVLLIVLFGIIHGRPYARSVIAIFYVLSMGVSFFFRIALRAILRKVRSKGYNKKHILMVGYSRATEGYLDRIRQNPEWGYSVYGILDNNVPLDATYFGVKVIGTLDELPRLIEENTFDEVAITLALKDYDKFENLVHVCEKNGVHTKFVPDYSSVIPTKPYTEDLEGLSVVNIRYVPLSNPGNRGIKRAVDIVGSLIAIILSSPIMLIFAFLVLVTSEGGVIFKQERVGYQGKTFNMYKFRSMRVQSASEEKKGWTTKGDPRVTPIGRFMRKTSIDELPQLFNILLGDMSLVGPRPERPQYVEKFKEEIPRYMVKHQVRPGLTGWAQVHGLRGDTSIKKRVEYDIYYIENWSFFMDIRIIFMTFFTGFINKNAY